MTEKTKQNKSKEIIGLIYLLCGLLLAVAYYIPGVNSGPLGSFFVNLGKGFVGPMAFVFPILFLFLSFSLFFRTTVLKHKIRVNHVFILIILGASLFHSFTVDLDNMMRLSYDSAQNQTVFKAIEVLWKASQNTEPYSLLHGSQPGGVIGGLLAMALQRLGGNITANALIITSLIAEAIVLGNLSIERIFQGIGSILMGIFRGIGSVVNNASNAIYELTDSHSSDEEIVTDTVSKKRTNRRLNDTNEPEMPWSQDRPVEVNHYTISGLSDSTNSAPKTRKQKPSQGFLIPDTSHDSMNNHDMPQIDTVRDYSIDGLENTDDEYAIPDFLLIGQEATSSVEKAKRPSESQHFEIPEPTESERDHFLLHDDKSSNEEDELLPIETINNTSNQPIPPAQNKQAEASPIEEEVDLLEEAEAAIEKPYEFPPITLLEPRPVINNTSNAKRIHDLATKLEATLLSFGVDAKVVHITTGPSITRFELKPGPGVKISKIVSLNDDIALSLAATTVRIEAPIPGKSAVGIEIPNSETAVVGLRSLIESEDYKQKKDKLLVPLGRDIPGQAIYCDISKMPHLLVAGATGSGKSVCINTILLSLLYRCSPNELKLLLIDPKVVELSIYDGIPHLLAPVVTDPKKAANTLNWAVAEMTRRYQLFAERHVRDMRSYNEDSEKGGYEKLPFIVLVIDELSDLMATSAKEVEDAISRLTAMARAAGIHLIIATQRPSVDVITGVIKANIPSRIAFAVSSQVDSRTILDGGGAEKLLGKGDMLYAPQSSSKATRGQGAFIADHEVENVISFLKAQKLKTYDKVVAEQIMSTPSATVDTGGSTAEPDEDELLPEAVEAILDAGYASVSLLQRRLNIGYPRAGRLVDSMEMKGYIGPFEGSKPRKVILTRSAWQLQNAQNAMAEEGETND